MRDESTHKGTGFVKFKDENVSKKLIEMSKELKEKPEEKVLIDPLNVLELKDRRIEILPVLAKDQLPSQEPIVKPNLKKKKKLKLADLIATDSKDKRNFKLALEGMPVTDDTIEGKDDAETDKRSRHIVK